jgi:hypothetical protein
LFNFILVAFHGVGFTTTSLTISENGCVIPLCSQLELKDNYKYTYLGNMLNQVMEPSELEDSTLLGCLVNHYVEIGIFVGVSPFIPSTIRRKH